MTQTPQSAQDDLAFLKSIVSSGDGAQASFGQGYVAAGVCYGLQMLLSAGQILGGLPATPAWSTTIGFAPTVVFLVALTWVIVRSGKAPPTGVVGRAVRAGFNGVGMANLALLVIIAWVAIQQHSLVTWLIYPCTVFVLQGAAWLMAYTLRRRAWLGVVAAGWFATALAMAFSIQTILYYVLWGGLGLFAWMVVPGLVMIHLARKSA